VNITALEKVSAFYGIVMLNKLGRQPRCETMRIDDFVTYSMCHLAYCLLQ